MIIHIYEILAYFCSSWRLLVNPKKDPHHIFHRGDMMNDESIGFLLKSPGIKFFKFRDKCVTFYQQVFFPESFTNYLVFNL